MVELIVFIGWLIDLVIFILFVAVILNWLIVLNVVNRRNQFVYMLADTLNRLTDPMLRPIRRLLPDVNGLDLSPLVLIIGLYFVKIVILPNLLKVFGG
jgi:YggT family protein